MYLETDAEREARKQEQIRVFGLRWPDKVRTLPDGSLAFSPKGRKGEVRPQAPKVSVRRKMHNAARYAFVLAKAARPDTGSCETCGNIEGERHAHHVGKTMSALKAEGLYADPSAHVFMWLCEACHIEQHKHESVSRIMRKRADSHQ